MHLAVGLFLFDAWHLNLSFLLPAFSFCYLLHLKLFFLSGELLSCNGKWFNNEIGEPAPYNLNPPPHALFVNLVTIV